MAKTHKMPYLCRSFSANEPYNQWLFYEKRPASSGILCVFATLQLYCGGVDQLLEEADGLVEGVDGAGVCAIYVFAHVSKDATTCAKTSTRKDLRRDVRKHVKTCAKSTCLSRYARRLPYTSQVSFAEYRSLLQGSLALQQTAIHNYPRRLPYTSTQIYIYIFEKCQGS